MVNSTFSPAEWLSFLSVIVAFFGALIAFLGVCFAVFVYVEWRKLRLMHEDMRGLEKRLKRELHESSKASHRVMAAYGVNDPDSRIALLQSTARLDPSAFNLYNTLGYAFIQKGDIQSAIDAFFQAIAQHPEDKAGYCDLAYAYLLAGNQKLCLDYLRKAVSVDATARDDILGDSRFAELHGAL